jgi:hypothetical protein
MRLRRRHGKRGKRRLRLGGPGQGISGMTDKSLDFGCTDAPTNHGELKRALENGGPVPHIPVAMGAVAPIYNLPEVKERWVIHDGQQFNEPLHYAALPPARVERAERQIEQVASKQ